MGREGSYDKLFSKNKKYKNCSNWQETDSRGRSGKLFPSLDELNKHTYFCLFVNLQFIVPFENFSLIWRRHHCRWRVANFDLCSVLMAIEQWVFLTCHTSCDTGLPFIMVISEDPWHSHLLPSFWQWICHYLFLRLRSVATGNRTPISRMRGERPTSTPPRIQLTSILLLSLRKWEIIYAAELVHFVMECLVLSPLVATDLIREVLNIKWQIHC